MIISAHRLLTLPELELLRGQLQQLAPRASSATQRWRWAWFAVLALIPIIYAFQSGSLVVFLGILLFEIAFILFLVWWTGRTDRMLDAHHTALDVQLASTDARVTTVTHAEYVGIEAYGMNLWLVQADFGTVLRLDGRTVNEPKRWPVDAFTILEHTLTTQPSASPRGEYLALQLRVVLPQGEPVLPLAVIGPQEYERIRHIVPTDGEPGHGRLTAMLDLLGYRPAPKTSLPTPGPSL